MTSSRFIEIAPGVWKLRLGTPELLTPLNVRRSSPAIERLSALPRIENSPLDGMEIISRKTARGFEVHLPLSSAEQIYGLGLQLLSFNQRGLKKTLRVNSDPRCDLGDSHAPVPFYASTAGYGVLVDTARYPTFYCGVASGVPDWSKNGDDIALSTEALYAARRSEEHVEMIVEVPAASGVDLYLFGGPAMREAVQRYNLFSGGGCVPPRWALGPWYRVRGDFTQEQVAAFADTLRREEMPCDVIGIEPGWQSHAYSCSHVWSDKFPDAARLIADLRQEHYQVNLWTHAFTHPSSPIHEPLLPYSGNYTVWGGLVPDLLEDRAREIFGSHYRKTTVEPGISGFKIDECDNSDFIHSPWSFPELSQFPSGADGEQMHSLFGVLLQGTFAELYQSAGRRTFGLVRSSHALAAGLPFALYSDLYDHRQFLRGIASASFCGFLWSPEVREAASGEDLIRRLQMAVVSPLAQVNGWYIANPPWKQWLVDKNNKDEFDQGWPEWQRRCRLILELRMRLIPYLHAAFFRYWQDGTPPFRALVLDYPRCEEAWGVDDEILIGDRLLAAPSVGPEASRRLWIPPGRWADFWTGQIYEGNRFLDFSLVEDQILLFVKSGSVLPLAKPTLHTEAAESFEIEARIYGDGALPATLIEESAPELPFDGRQVNILSLAWDSERQDIVCNRKNSVMPAIYSVSSIRQFKR